MHGYVVPSRIGTLACTTLQLEFSVYSGKNDVKKYVKNLELINKDKKKKKAVRYSVCTRRYSVSLAIASSFDSCAATEIIDAQHFFFYIILLNYV